MNYFKILKKTYFEYVLTLKLKQNVLRFWVSRRLEEFRKLQRNYDSEIHEEPEAAHSQSRESHLPLQLALNLMDIAHQHCIYLEK